MTSENDMSLFNVIINESYKHALLTHLSVLNSVHIKPRKTSRIGKKLQEGDPLLEKIKKIRQNFTNLSRKLKITESDFSELKIKKDERVEFAVKDVEHLINHVLEEIEFFLNRVLELERLIANAKIQLENTNLIKEAYIFLEQFHLKRDSLDNLNLIEFKVYTTFSKNVENLKNLFEFSEIPVVYQTSSILEDRIIFYIIYPKDRKEFFNEKLALVHAEEVPILKKYLYEDGINFMRIVKEIDVIENTLRRYEKELIRLRDDNLPKFAAINEIIENIEEYNWVDHQFEEYSVDKSSLEFYVPISKKDEVNQKLSKDFKDMIMIETVDITKNKPVFESKKTKQILIQDEKDEKVTDLREESPTVMKNFFLFKPYESLTKMYGVPSYSEVDPTPFLFFTFPIIFGLMFGDIGHGICLVVAGLIGAFLFKKRKGNLYNFCWIIFYCGFGAIFVGFLYGAFFGSDNIFGMVLQPVTIPFLNYTIQNPMQDIMSIFKLVIVIGVIHINIGWFIQGINYWKLKRRYLAITDSFFKILLLTGGSILILTWGFNINAWLTAPFPILLPLIPGLLLVISKPLGRILGISYLQEESIGSLLGEGSIETFETLLSILSNVSSYIRLLALALAHISLMVAIAAMIELIPANIFLSQVWIILGLIFGNFVVIILEGLLVFINTLRLHFYEFFFKFYRGSGIEFFPFHLDENYSQITFKIEQEKDVISEEIEKEIETKQVKEDFNKAKSIITQKFL